MRILIVNDYMRCGGAEEYCHFLARQLMKKGHRVLLVGGKKDPKQYKTPYFLDFYNIRERLRIWRILKEFKPDIVHIHNLLGYLSPSIISEIKRKEIPLTMKIGDTRPFCPKGNLIQKNGSVCNRGYSIECLTSGCLMDGPKILGKIQHLLNLGKLGLYRTLVQKNVDRIFAPSQFVAEKAESAFQKEVEIIRNPAFWPPRESHHKESSGKKILFVGPLFPIKGVKYLIESFSKIEERFENIQLEIIGKGKQKQSLQNIVERNGLSEKVNFRGFVEHSSLKEKYCEADVFCLPSIIPENSPLTIPEAMSQGTPVITTNIGGQAELVKDNYNGFLVNPRDSRDLVEKIYKILKNDDLRERMSENSLEYAKKFSPEKHIQKIEKLFKKLVD